MEKLNKEQADEVLIAVNLIICALIMTDHPKPHVREIGMKYKADGVARLRAIGVEIEDLK